MTYVTFPLLRHLLRPIIIYLQKPLEPYQPLFGMEVGGRRAGRSCADRWSVIRECSVKMGFLKPGALLVDVGSSFGYFVMAAAQEGYKAIGIDTTWRLYLIQQLLGCHLGLSKKMRIIKGVVTPGFIPDLFEARPFGRDRADVVLLLNIIQHMLYMSNEDSVHSILDEVSRYSRAVFIELPSSTEKHYWSDRYLRKPEGLLEGKFSNGYILLGYSKDLNRPIYVGMN